MSALRVLFADDEIPYGDERDAAMRQEMLAFDPSVDAEHYERATGEMRNSVIALESAGYDVTVGRTIAETLALIEISEFDVAIIDLGWWGDSAIEVSKRPSAGWKLVRALNDVAKRAMRAQPPIIMYSMRYLDDKTLAMEAVNGGTLPLPKNYTDASHQTLIAAVEYLGRAAKSADHFEQNFIDSNFRYWKDARKRLDIYFWITLFGVGAIVSAAVGMVIYGVVSEAGVGVLQGAAAVLTGLFSGILLVLYRRLTEDVTVAREAASQAVMGRENRD